MERTSGFVQIPSIVLVVWSFLFVLLNLHCQNHSLPQTSGSSMERATDSSQPRYTNALIHEKSPYLLQHAHNPVNWYPWGSAALEKAKQEDKPIFLSIGYATCHWCHVMEKESFEDEEVATLLNTYFVAIKVDREERPDIDAVYMEVCQAVTGSGGWPLSVFLTPDLKPFFVGTYFPKESRYGRPGFVDILRQIAYLWQTDRKKLLESAQKIVTALATRPNLNAELSPTIIDSAIALYKQRFDPAYGGFGTAPKFPSPHNLLFLLQQFVKTQDSTLLHIVTTTLRHMRYGGIYDHLGFGFHRYSTDQRWLVPHFEKMLYDQAMLLLAYTRAAQLTGEPLFHQTAAEIATYVLREMTHPDGGFYSAEDADSEGEEGKFYVWTYEELKQSLAPDELRLLEAVFEIQPDGNFREEASGHQTGTNILYRTKSDKEVAQQLGLDIDSFRRSFEKVRQKLFAIREQRVHPLKDDKILTDWNGLMIAALAVTAQAFGDERYQQAAERAWQFIHTHLVDDQGRLFHRWRENDRSVPALLDDYVFLAYGGWELYRATLNPQYLERSIALLRTAIDQFWDPTANGFFQTSAEHQQPLFRHKDAYDGAYPSGNGIAATLLAYIGHLTSDTVLLNRAERTIAAFGKYLQRYPIGFAQSLIAFDFLRSPKREIIIADTVPAEHNDMLHFLQRQFLPYTVFAYNDGSVIIRKLIPYIQSQTPVNQRSTAYICRNYACLAPITDYTEFQKQLEQQP